MVKKGNLEAAKAAAKKAVKKAAAKTKAACKAAPNAAGKASPSKPAKVSVKTEPGVPKSTAPTTLTCHQGGCQQLLGPNEKVQGPQCSEGFEHYCSLGKFDSKKNEMVAQWKQDKGTWWKQVLDAVRLCWLVDKAGMSKVKFFVF